MKVAFNILYFVLVLLIGVSGLWISLYTLAAYALTVWLNSKKLSLNFLSTFTQTGMLLTLLCIVFGFPALPFAIVTAFSILLLLPEETA